MAKTLYKTLFEIRVLHEFYLTDNDGSSIFDSDDADKRSAFLDKKFAGSQPSVTADLTFDIPDALLDAFRNYRLHLMPTYSGCVIATEVIEKIQIDGSVLYAPVSRLPDDFECWISISKKTSLPDIISNARSDSPIPLVYFFSNDNTPSAKTFPFLTAAIPAFDAGRTYLQGELASFGPADTRQFDGKAGGWHPIAGNDFANESDRMVLPFQFDYRFDTITPVTSASVDLLDPGGALVRSASFSDANGMKKISLNFANGKTLLPPLIPISQGLVYSLKMTINGAAANPINVIFLDGYDAPARYWGLVRVKTTGASADFHLYGDDGFLKNRTVGGKTSPPPVFDICLKSRLTWWRYINDRSGKILLSDNTKPYLDSTGTGLVSKSARPSTWLPTLFGKKDYLPNPASYDTTVMENGLLYTNIRIPVSKLFPVDTS